MIFRVICILFLCTLVHSKLEQKNGYTKVCNYVLMPVKVKHIVYVPANSKNRISHLASRIQSTRKSKLQVFIQQMKQRGYKVTPALRIVRVCRFKLIPSLIISKMK